MHGPCLGSMCGEPAKCLNTFDRKTSMIRMNHLINRVHFCFNIILIEVSCMLKCNKNSHGESRFLFVCFSFFWPSLFFCEKEETI